MGLIKPIIKQAAACIPPELLNISTESPSRKHKKINNDLFISMGNRRMNKMYINGFR